LLDSGSKIFLLRDNNAPTLTAPYEETENPLQITALNGQFSSAGRKYYSDLIKIEIGSNGLTTLVSCEIAHVGKYDIMIPCR